MQLNYRILPFLILLFLESCAQQPVQCQVKPLIKKIDFSFLEGCETGSGKCDPVIIERMAANDSVRLEFPCGGTQSTVFLYGGPGDQPLKKDNRLGCDVLPTLDLTDLADGSYGVRMLSCGSGGSFTILLRTKNPGIHL